MTVVHQGGGRGEHQGRLEGRMLARKRGAMSKDHIAIRLLSESIRNDSVPVEHRSQPRVINSEKIELRAWRGILHTGIEL